MKSYFSRVRWGYNTNPMTPVGKGNPIANEMQSQDGLRLRLISGEDGLV